MTKIKIQTTTVTEYDTTTGKSRVVQHYARVLGVGTNAKKTVRRTLVAEKSEEVYL